MAPHRRQAPPNGSPTLVIWGLGRNLRRNRSHAALQLNLPEVTRKGEKVWDFNSFLCGWTPNTHLFHCFSRRPYFLLQFHRNEAKHGRETFATHQCAECSFHIPMLYAELQWRIQSGCRKLLIYLWSKRIVFWIFRAASRECQWKVVSIRITLYKTYLNLSIIALQLSLTLVCGRGLNHMG